MATPPQASPSPNPAKRPITAAPTTSPGYERYPGPPVFLSTIRPAAMPFRASHSAPQPLAFSSGSCLPTSSPPGFSNGSVELHQQLSSAMDESMPAGVTMRLFSVHKCCCRSINSEAVGAVIKLL
ncbi:uncharacterized protein LOC120127367 [Hibiscus syriacus]|uniref:uncharacterized protein LOC120127367 n=1 Tax=Hibiscus syriacus TaxID=106335 RepID=UPI00192407E9|nr:uncharacterized protein LOC120127367 [Hibiscus syriacus]